MSSGLSHITFVSADPDAMHHLMTDVLKARCVYDSGSEFFSISQERFYLVGEIWIAVMKGDPLAERTYNHVAFKIDEAEFDDRLDRIKALGLEIRPPRPRVEGEGRSIYFYSPDGHFLELHTGTLDERLARYAKAKEAVG